MEIEAQEGLDKEFSNKQKVGRIEKLDISGKNLSGSLTLIGFTRLKELIVSGNNLSKIDLRFCRNLRFVDVSNNSLRELILFENNSISSFLLNKNLLSFVPRNLNNFSLEELELSDNLVSVDLSVFSELVNLRRLNIENNPIIGSLFSLINLSNLEHLDISSTKISEGLEFLPTSLKEFRCNHTNFFRTLGNFRRSCDASNYQLEFNENFLYEFNGKLIDQNLSEDLQEEWESNGFDYHETREGIKAGLKLTDSYYAEWLKKIGFGYETVLSGKIKDEKSYFIYSYKGDLRRDKSLKIDASWGLHDNQKFSQCAFISELVIDSYFTKIKGFLNIDGWIHLRKISIEKNYISELRLFNLPSLESLNLHLTTLDRISIENCQSIVDLDLSSNNLTDLIGLNKIFEEKLRFLNLSDNKFADTQLHHFSRFNNLRSLFLNSNDFTGSLIHLRNLKKLEILNISYTRINLGFKFLPRNLKFFFCANSSFQEFSHPEEYSISELENIFSIN